MIDFSEMPKSSVRGAIASHYALGQSGMILTPGEFLDTPYYLPYFLSFKDSEFAETIDGTHFFYLNHEEQEAFNLKGMNRIWISKNEDGKYYYGLNQIEKLYDSNEIQEIYDELTEE